MGQRKLALTGGNQRPEVRTVSAGGGGEVVEEEKSNDGGGGGGGGGGIRAEKGK